MPAGDGSGQEHFVVSLVTSCIVKPSVEAEVRVSNTALSTVSPVLDRLDGNLSTGDMLGEEWNSSVVEVSAVPQRVSQCGRVRWFTDVKCKKQLQKGWGYSEVSLEIVCSEQAQLEEIALGLFPIGYGIYSWRERFHTYSGKSAQSPLQ